jgi:predicted HTH domain antitoxin
VCASVLCKLSPFRETSKDIIRDLKHARQVSTKALAGHCRCNSHEARYEHIEYQISARSSLEPKEFEREARILLGVKLYESGKLTTGLAAKIAGVPRVTFLFLLSQYGLSPFGETPKDVARDLRHTRQAHHRK